MILSPDPGSPTRPSRGTLLEIDPNIRNGAAIPPDVDPLSNAISKTPDLRPIASTSGDRDENSNSNTTSNQVAISPIADSSPWEADARRIQTLSTSTLYIPPADPSRQGAELADGSTAPPIATPVMSVQQVSTQQGGASVLPLQSPNDNALFVTFLFLNGNRHRMILDAQCFEQNNILPRDPSDPLTTSIIALKELLWRIWKAEWGEKPQLPGIIRLVYLGRLLDEHVALKNYKITSQTPNVIHVSVPPAKVIEEVISSRGRKGLRRGPEGDIDRIEARCHCVIL